MIVIASAAPFVTTENTVRHNNVPADAALKIPASVIAPVPVPAANVATYVTESFAVDDVACAELVRAVREAETAATRAVCPAAAAVLLATGAAWWLSWRSRAARAAQRRRVAGKAVKGRRGARAAAEFKVRNPLRRV